MPTRSRIDRRSDLLVGGLQLEKHGAKSVVAASDSHSRLADPIAAPSGKHRTVSASLPGACSAFRSAADIPDGDLAPVQIVRITRAGTPPTIARSRTFLVTTAPAVTTTLSPMVTPERIVAFDPIQTFFFRTIDA